MNAKIFYQPLDCTIVTSQLLQNSHIPSPIIFKNSCELLIQMLQILVWYERNEAPHCSGTQLARIKIKYSEMWRHLSYYIQAYMDSLEVPAPSKFMLTCPDKGGLRSPEISVFTEHYCLIFTFPAVQTSSVTHLRMIYYTSLCRDCLTCHQISRTL